MNNEETIYITFSQDLETGHMCDLYAYFEKEEAEKEATDRMRVKELKDKYRLSGILTGTLVGNP